MNRSSWLTGGPRAPIVRHPDDEQRERIREAIGMAVGHAASLHFPASREVFKATEAIEIGNELIATIEREMNL